MIGIRGLVRASSNRAVCVAGALAPDNLPGMATAVDGDTVTFRIEGTHLRSVTATVDDYLMNLTMAEELCAYVPHARPEDMTDRTGTSRQKF